LRLYHSYVEKVTRNKLENGTENCNVFFHTLTQPGVLWPTK